jgi:hypothetical protein
MLTQLCAGQAEEYEVHTAFSGRGYAKRVWLVDNRLPEKKIKATSLSIGWYPQKVPDGLVLGWALSSAEPHHEL